MKGVAMSKPSIEHMLTTIDNPYSPFTQWDEWLDFDTLKGYDSCGYLARVTKTASELSDADQSLAIEDAIDEILMYNVNGMYRKVAKT